MSLQASHKQRQAPLAAHHRRRPASKQAGAFVVAAQACFVQLETYMSISVHSIHFFASSPESNVQSHARFARFYFSLYSFPEY